VHEQRLYQLIRQSGDVGEHVFSIEFPDAEFKPIRLLSGEDVMSLKTALTMGG